MPRVIKMMSQPEVNQKFLHWKRVLSIGLFLAYHGYRGLLLAFFSFPVAASFVISGLLLDPAIPASDKQDLLLLIISRFEQVFNYSITLALFMALAVMLLEPLKYARMRFSRSRSVS